MLAHNAMLSRNGRVAVHGADDERIDGRPWVPRYQAREFSGSLATTDLANAARPNDHTESLTLFSTNVDGTDLVTGLTYLFTGKITPATPLGPPSSAFPVQVNGGPNPTYLYLYLYLTTPTPLTATDLHFLDPCNGPPPTGDLGGPTPSYGNRDTPRSPFLFAQSGNLGVSSIEIRDAEAGSLAVAKWNVKVLGNDR